MLEFVHPNKPDHVPVSVMKDGDVGIIVKWPHWGYTGRIVQRVSDQLITLGASSLYGISQIPADPRCKVRLLRMGDTLRETGERNT